jgi:hypothetical protein
MSAITFKIREVLESIDIRQLILDEVADKTARILAKKDIDTIIDDLIAEKVTEEINKHL